MCRVIKNNVSWGNPKKLRIDDWFSGDSSSTRVGTDQFRGKMTLLVDAIRHTKGEDLLRAVQRFLGSLMSKEVCQANFTSL
jgi:hypothetical protein